MDSNKCNNYSLSVSPSPSFENSGQQRKYDFISDILYNFTLANTKCMNRENPLPTFIYGKYVKNILKDSNVKFC